MRGSGDGVAGRIAPDGFPLAFPLSEAGWAWLAANHEVSSRDDVADDSSCCDVPELADFEPPLTAEEEETLF